MSPQPVTPWKVAYEHFGAAAEQSLAEIRFGIELVADAGRRRELKDWLAHKVRPMSPT
jgi:hypothetical protein